jgi:hypothetical protein
MAAPKEAMEARERWAREVHKNFVSPNYMPPMDIAADIEMALLCEALHVVPSMLKNEDGDALWKVRTVLAEKAQVEADAAK